MQFFQTKKSEKYSIAMEKKALIHQQALLVLIKISQVLVDLVVE